MRKEQKKQVVELLGGLVKSQKFLTSFEKDVDKNSVLSMLVNCQNIAITMGNQIDETEGKGTYTVGLLEQYCELVYGVYREIERLEMNMQVISDRINDISRILFEIAESIEKEIVVRREIVFLPYKACMWDSLESIWKVACEDPLCDAYVIPIPYFEKNKDGTVRKMIYEADLYPSYVPIVNYESYDLNKRRPDAIFIHNPYDGSNIVTTVHPYFYASNLKKMTDLLVYVPYFILNEISPNDSDAIKSMKHQCVLPAMFHANKVVLQSKAMKQIYVNELVNYVGEYARDYFNQVIESWGSPKVDCFLQKINDRTIIPDEWIETIGRKKVVFYNTSIGALLYWGDAYLEKVKRVFQYFVLRDDVILLWRPHPLMDATIHSMRGEVSDRWNDVRNFFQQNKVGILDTSADMYPALAASDAYYGDPSSIASLYLYSEKPEWMHGFKKDGNKIQILDISQDFSEERKVKSPEYEKQEDYYRTVGERIYCMLMR